MGINLHKIARHEVLSEKVRIKLKEKRKRLLTRISIINELLAKPAKEDG